MASQICYHACLVKDGTIEYITPVNTKHNALADVNYWKKNRPQFADSFIYKIIPSQWKSQIEDYWQKYEDSHPASPGADPDSLPW